MARALLAALLVVVWLVAADAGEAATSRAARAKISWSIGASRHFKQGPGALIVEQLEFVADKDIDRASVIVIPGYHTSIGLRLSEDDEPARLVEIGQVLAGERYSIELRSEIPATATRRSYMAVVRVRDRNLSLNRQLRIVHRIDYSAWRRLYPVQRPTATPTPDE